MKIFLFFLFLSFCLNSYSQNTDPTEIPIERKVKRFENAIRDLHRITVNNDFTREMIFIKVLEKKEEIAVDCPIKLFQNAITIDNNLLINWINTNDIQYKKYIEFLEFYIRQNI